MNMPENTKNQSIPQSVVEKLCPERDYDEVRELQCGSTGRVCKMREERWKIQTVKLTYEELSAIELSQSAEINGLVAIVGDIILTMETSLAEIHFHQQIT